MSTNNTFQIADYLRNKGYNTRQAARACGCSAQHMDQFVKGLRQSNRLMAKIAQLPSREYKSRRPVEA